MTNRQLNLTVGLMVLALAGVVIAQGRPGDIDRGTGAGEAHHLTWPLAQAPVAAARNTTDVSTGDSNATQFGGGALGVTGLLGLLALLGIRGLRRQRLVACLMLAGAAGTCVAAPGDIDPGFSAGVRDALGLTGYLAPRAAVPAPDGSLDVIQAVYDDDGWSGPTLAGYLLGKLSVQGQLVAPFKLASAGPLGRLRSPAIRARNGDLLVATSPVDVPWEVQASSSASTRIGILRLDPTGIRNNQFGTEGVALLPGSEQPVGQYRMRQVAALAEMSDGRILAVEAVSCADNGDWRDLIPGDEFGWWTYGARDASSWGLPVAGLLCHPYPRLESARSLMRLLGDGRVDTTFGASGKLDLAGIGEVALLEGRADGAAVLADRSGRVRLIDANGQIKASAAVDLQDASGFLLDDGRVVLTGTRSGTSHELWIARLNPDLSVDTTLGSGTGLVKLAFELRSLGNSGLSAYPGELRRSPDGRFAYLAVNLASTGTRDYLCGGVMRLTLGAVPAPDPAFGRGGFSCITRSGLILEATHLTVQRDEGLLLFYPDSHYLSSGNGTLIRLHTADHAAGPGMLTIQGMTSNVSRYSGNLVLNVGRSGGHSGAVSARWEVRIGVLSRPPDSERGNVPLESGELSWADGEDGDQFIRFQFQNNALTRNYEGLQVKLVQTGGNAMLGRAEQRIRIVNAQVPDTSASNAASSGEAAQSGGGALGVPGLLGLLALLGARGMRRRAHQFLPTLAAACTVFAATAGVCVAAPGDIDPGFGDRGRVSTPYPPLVGKDGNLSLIDVDGRNVTVVDADGKPVAGAAFAVPWPVGARLVYGWSLDAQGSYLINLTLDTAEGLQSGLMRLDPQGKLDSRFGVGGVAVVMDRSRVAASPGYPLQPLPQIIRSVQALEDGRILLLEVESPGVACAKQLDLGIYGRMWNTDACYWEGPQRFWMRRLLSDGRLDEGFGAGGRLLVGNFGLASMLAARADGSAVFVDQSGFVRSFTPEGTASQEGRVGFTPSGVTALPDGGVLLTGQRDAETVKGIWAAHLDAHLQPIVAAGATSGEIRLDVSGRFSGNANSESYAGPVSSSPDGRYAYIATNFVDKQVSQSRCGGVARLQLVGAPEIDEAFGRHGLACLLPDKASGVRVLPSGDVLLLEGTGNSPPPRSPSLYRLHAQDLPGPGFVRFTGPVSGANYSGFVDEGAGTVTLRVKRLAGMAGAVRVDWQIVETKGNPVTSGAQSGRLEWADGDDTDKTITLALIDDQLPSPRDSANGYPFYSSITLALKAVDTTAPSAVVSESTSQLLVLDNDSLPLNAQLQELQASENGGGGALGTWALLALCALWRRRFAAGLG